MSALLRIPSTLATSRISTLWSELGCALRPGLCSAVWAELVPRSGPHSGRRRRVEETRQAPLRTARTQRRRQSQRRKQRLTRRTAFSSKSLEIKYPQDPFHDRVRWPGALANDPLPLTSTSRSPTLFESRCWWRPNRRDGPDRAGSRSRADRPSGVAAPPRSPEFPRAIRPPPPGEGGGQRGSRSRLPLPVKACAEVGENRLATPAVFNRPGSAVTPN